MRHQGGPVKPALLALAIVAACGPDKIEVHDNGVTDYNKSAFDKAVDGFVAAGRTPAAYATLAATVRGLRPGMDKAVADETELKMVVLALAPVQQLHAKPMTEQVAALALTVWPTLLAPRIEADALLEVRDSKA